MAGPGTVKRLSRVERETSVLTVCRHTGSARGPEVDTEPVTSATVLSTEVESEVQTSTTGYEKTP